MRKCSCSELTLVCKENCWISSKIQLKLFASLSIRKLTGLLCTFCELRRKARSTASAMELRGTGSFHHYTVVTSQVEKVHLGHIQDNWLCKEETRCLPSQYHSSGGSQWKPKLTFVKMDFVFSARNLQASEQSQRSKTTESSSLRPDGFQSLNNISACPWSVCYFLDSFLSTIHSVQTWHMLRTCVRG